MSNYFQLDVSNNEGLSYAIDRALDKEFSKDITLGKIRQWNTIFDYIKRDQAEQTQQNQKQFTEQDNNVKNYSHYQVNSGLYNITQDVWTKIVAFVKEEIDLGKVDVKELQNPEQKEVVEKKEVETDDKILSDASIKSNEENLRYILSKANIELSEEDFLDVLSKYENKIALQAGGMDISNEKIEQDILAYITGKQYEKTEDVFVQTMNKKTTYLADIDNVLVEYDPNSTKEEYVIQGVKNALSHAAENPDDKEGAYRLNSEAYQQLGNAFMQLYDTSGDNLVDFNEFIAYEEKRAQSKISNTDAAKKIFEYIAKDNYIDEKEMTTMQYAMAKFGDVDKNGENGSTISYKNWFLTQEALNGIGTNDNSQNHIKAITRLNELRDIGNEVIYNYKKHCK